ncbi:hypothetical protein Tco_0392012, partial [Tanacetum coccineum]
MPSLTTKWLFSQFRAKFVSSHRLSIFSKWVRHVEKELLKTEKSSINTSIVFSIMSWKIAIIQLWINSFCSFSTTVKPPFFGTQCIGLTQGLSEIG